MDPFKTSSYRFDLPPELIAAEPLRERDQSRLLVVNRKSKTLEHRSVSELPEILPEGALVVANNTRVFKARLSGERTGTGGKVEFLMVRQRGPLIWEGLMKSGARVLPGFSFRIPKPDGTFLSAEVVARTESSSGAVFTAKFAEDPVGLDLGEVPLPPYIVERRATLAKEARATQERKTDELDTYNTLFAKETGSVAAPTAGRHVTPELIRRMRERRIGWEEITLHVGIGTFKPVMTEDVRQHDMHEEWTSILPAVSDRIVGAKREGRTLLAIGTTTARTLEARAFLQNGEFILESGACDVNVFIHPGAEYRWKAVDWMLTNFHLPESTLIMMIASRIGDIEFTLHAYREAIRNRYRFYSYGDAMLITDR